jgi:hypothetical protein
MLAHGVLQYSFDLRERSSSEQFCVTRRPFSPDKVVPWKYTSCGIRNSGSTGRDEDLGMLSKLTLTGEGAIA